MIIKDADIEVALRLSRDASRVQRFHTVPIVKENTVGTHTFNLLGILFACVPSAELRWQLLGAAWQHDVAEAEAGDVPSPTKRALGGMDAFEQKVLRDCGWYSMEGYLTARELRWLKLADSLEGWMFCVEELRMGNQLIAVAAGNFRNYVLDRLADLSGFEAGAESESSPSADALENFKKLIIHTGKAHREWEDHHGC